MLQILRFRVFIFDACCVESDNGEQNGGNEWRQTSLFEKADQSTHHQKSRVRLDYCCDWHVCLFVSEYNLQSMAETYSEVFFEEHCSG